MHCEATEAGFPRPGHVFAQAWSLEAQPGRRGTATDRTCTENWCIGQGKRKLWMFMQTLWSSFLVGRHPKMMRPQSRDICCMHLGRVTVPRSRLQSRDRAGWK